MSDYIPDSPVIGRSWCPGCEPEVDPMSEILDVRHCEDHTPARSGEDDTRLTWSYVPLTEAGGESNAAWCDALHRRCAS